MTEPRSLVLRLLDTPGIAQVVPRLPPEVLHRLIDRCGLEACADLVALASPRQLQRLLDIDVWRAPAAGQDEAFDPSRFAEWLALLLELGASVAADRLAAMDLHLVVGGLSAHVRVFDAAVVTGYTTLDGERVAARESIRQASASIGGFVAETRGTSDFDTIVELLSDLHDERPVFFHRVMRGCVALSDAGRERDGLDALAAARGQQLADLALDREGRRERQGYVSPAEARAFLQAARGVRLDGPRPSIDATAHAYLRDLSSDAFVDDEAASAVVPLDDQVPMTAAMQILAEAGVVAPPRALLPPAALEDAPLALVRAFAEGHMAAQEELAFLANAVAAGGALHERSFTLQEASDYVLATCNLGLENWPAGWPSPDLLTAFRIGWSLLHEDVCQFATHALADALAGIDCLDRDTQWALQALRHDLLRHLDAGQPWRAGPALDAILSLDAAAWAVLHALIAECPSMHVAVTSTPLKIDPAAVTYVSRNADVAAVRAYLATLASRLAS